MGFKVQRRLCATCISEKDTYQMNTSKHTPGPWVVTRDYSIVTDATPAILLAKTASANYAANAKLIAAAPDMAEALRECVAAYVAVDHANTYTSDDVLSVVKANERIRAAQDKARAALAKAGARA